MSTPHSWRLKLKQTSAAQPQAIVAHPMTPWRVTLATTMMMMTMKMRAKQKIADRIRIDGVSFSVTAAYL
uniref:Secreted protein n=1 Tax=Angiostrongylus cantonensis TaxID=6313 RepID=A0A0K0DGZ0_ANGCA